MFQDGRLILALFISLFLKFSTSRDTITLLQPLKDGDVLVSNEETFALGFFSLGNSSNRYVGIWYNKVSEQTVVWVANRDRPITTSSGILSVDELGNLVLHDDKDPKYVFWSTNVLNIANYSVSAQLLDSGNLVLFQDQNRNVYSWQSFDYPSNTFLPGMKLGLDKKTGLNRVITSWKSNENPGVGDYAYKMKFVGSTQLYLFKGNTPIFRTGSWTGQGWSGVPEMTENFIFSATYVDNNDEVYVSYFIRNSSIFSRLVINESGSVERLTWHEGNHRWFGIWSAPNDQCDGYNECGPFGFCDLDKSDTFVCNCFPGYEPQSPQDWYLRDGTRGCKRKVGAEICLPGAGFVELARMKIPDTSMACVDMSLGLEACKESCHKNCTCMGYAVADISKEIGGCITWYKSMIDTRRFSYGGQSLYIRVDAAELVKYSSRKPSSSRGKLFLFVGVLLIAVGFVFCIFILIYIKKKKANRRAHEIGVSFIDSLKSIDGSLEKDMGENFDLRVFDMSTIVSATDNFSLLNKLGEGGFGSVYKGRLLNGQEVAIKRLSKGSGQGTQEFKNEVTLIAKLQHKNLVRLLGYCFHTDEKMLVYEYLPNKGLDYFIFDQEKGSLLDWKKRFQIIKGIVRGLLYLHQDSRLRIIHRDLKASNILLDADLNPKISDFGMAKIFGGDQAQATTLRVVGTYGYMSPEYAMEGLFSVKSDVYSFGILVLEIISGRRNNSYYLESSVNLIGHVWDLWKQDRALEELADDRPTMTDIAFMLSNRDKNLPSPKQPAFIFRKVNYGNDGFGSINDETITIVHAR
uniref:G-type lectin S-receptor-like serine/threonine-protein kinase RKS1 isoform X2 n=1 Tax=Erigeron canadensis TaxID=72917 RepID=UPI001CB91D97|nr:G-type lectin S-receptor-like serine/threonine-protein kinase RKS1 isoform X2 [Erigeron canadensis]